MLFTARDTVGASSVIMNYFLPSHLYVYLLHGGFVVFVAVGFYADGDTRPKPLGVFTEIVGVEAKTVLTRLNSGTRN